VLAARGKQVDLFGMVVLALVTAFGERDSARPVARFQTGVLHGFVGVSVERILHCFGNLLCGALAVNYMTLVRSANSVGFSDDA